VRRRWRAGFAGDQARPTFAGVTRTLIIAGLVLIALGLLWPWLSKLGLGRLPGDIVVRRENFSFYFPIVTSLLLSAVATLIFWLFRR
jgi:hypothetical protein